MRTAWQLLTGPAFEPISLEDAKLDRRIETNADDVGTERRIRSARNRAEYFLGRGLVTQTWKYAQDAFCDEWLLPMAAPLQSVTSVKYYDEASVLQTVAPSTYLVDTLSEPGRISLASGESWPAAQSRPLAVEVTYVVGWATVEEIPPGIVDALYLFLGDRDELRENTVMGVGYAVQKLPDGAEQLLAPFQRFWYGPPAYAEY